MLRFTSYSTPPTMHEITRMPRERVRERVRVRERERE